MLVALTVTVALALTLAARERQTAQRRLVVQDVERGRVGLVEARDLLAVQRQQERPQVQIGRHEAEEGVRGDPGPCLFLGKVLVELGGEISLTEGGF